MYYKLNCNCYLKLCIFQYKEFILLYNKIAEKCFQDCVTSFNEKTLTENEVLQKFKDDCLLYKISIILPLDLDDAARRTDILPIFGQGQFSNLYKFD